MAQNIQIPSQLAAIVVAHFKDGAASILAACTEVANAFSAFKEGAWSQSEFLTFLDKLAEDKIGTGSSAFLKPGSKGSIAFDSSLKAGVYFQIISVGRCEGFKAPEFVLANRTSSYATLYRLSVLHNMIFDKTSGDAEKKREMALKAIMELVERHGVSLTRKDVDEAIKQAQNEFRSHPPRKKVAAEQAEPTVSLGDLKLADLLARDERYDLIVMTPPDEFLNEAEGASPSTLLDRLPYQELRKAQSEAILIGSGRHLGALKKLSELSGDLSYCYCVRAKHDARSIIDISEQLLVFSSSPFHEKESIAKGETIDQFVRRVVSNRASHNTKKLHLFGDQNIESWDVCSAENSYNES